jgi:hypothetical protein
VWRANADTDKTHANNLVICESASDRVSGADSVCFYSTAELTDHFV